MSKPQRIDFEVSFVGLDGASYDAGMMVTSEGCEGRYSGPPEDCYPAEDPELEIVTISKGMVDLAPDTWASVMDAEIEERILEEGVEKAVEWKRNYEEMRYDYDSMRKEERYEL